MCDGRNGKTVIFDNEDDLLSNAVIDPSLPAVIMLVQEALNNAGYDCGVPDGNIGPTSLVRIQSFQTDNGLEATGVIDDAMIEKLGITKDAKIATLKANGVEFPVFQGDGWALMNEYFYTDSIGLNYYMCEVKNTSSEDLKISGNVTYFDENDNMIGIGKDSIDVCDPGKSVLLVFSNEDSYNRIEWNFNAEPPKHYSGVLSEIDLETTLAGDKAIISATNNGDKTAQDVEYNILFFDENGYVVSMGRGFITDDDGEIKVGNTQMEQAQTFGVPFASVKVFLNGKASN